MDGDYLPITYGDENPDTQFLIYNSMSRYVSKLPSTGSQARAIRRLSLATHRMSSPTSTGHFRGTNVKSWTNGLHNCRTWASLWETSTTVCGDVLPNQPGIGTRSSNPEPCWTRFWNMRQLARCPISEYEAGQNGVHPRGYADGPVTAGRLRGARPVDHGYSDLHPVVWQVATFPHMAHCYVKVPL